MERRRWRARQGRRWAAFPIPLLPPLSLFVSVPTLTTHESRVTRETNRSKKLSAFGARFAKFLLYWREVIKPASGTKDSEKRIGRIAHNHGELRLCFGRLNEGRSQKSKGTGLLPPPAQTTFKWRIDGFSSLLDKDEGWTYSRVFEIMGLNWYLKLNPRDRKSDDKNEYVSLKLELARASVRSSTVVEASFKFLIYDQSYGKHQEHQVRHNFQTASTCSGTSCMIPLTTLKKHSSGFLVGNSCVFGVEFIQVDTAKDNDTSETLFVQKANNIFSDPDVYTWNIENFFALKSTDNSPEFEIGGHKWSIIIYPSGSGNNGNYLSLYLEAKMSDTLHQNSANLVELSICVKDQETGKHRKLTGRCQFSKNSTKWGWEKFISLENFKDSSNGYLVKTKCCIEVEVAIVGSSKME